MSRAVTLGPAGNFSHAMAIFLFKTDIMLVPTIQKVFTAVIQEQIPGVLPIENSEAGSVAATLDGLMQHDLYITADCTMAIHHHLAARGPPEACTAIYAHPQSDEQCSIVLDELSVPVIHTASNAASAMAMRDNPGTGAVISDLLAEMHSLPISRSNIENNPKNETRFIVLETKPDTTKEPYRCSLVIDPKEDHAGLLCDILLPFRNRNVNLTRIESRPSKRRLGSYIFFLDCACTGEWREAIRDLQQVTQVKELGCYPHYTRGA
ncbi:MAG: prephenate dehydratase [Methanospirillaceae archaeon]|nr:prephenate dehydratase [Methanospirillaceae archaeon]